MFGLAGLTNGGSFTPHPSSATSYTRIRSARGQGRLNLKASRHIPGSQGRYVYQIDRGLFYANKTMDLNYIYEIEARLPLVVYQRDVCQVMVDILRRDHPRD